MNKFSQTLFLIIFFCTTLSAQDLSNEGEKEVESRKGSQNLSLGLGHTQLSKGIRNGKNEWVPLASWSFNYNYWVSNKWGLSLQNDWVLESYVVEVNDIETIERDRPLAIIPSALFHFADNWIAIGGFGVELSKEKNLPTARLGIEYGRELPGNWEASIALVWDNKFKYYNSWGLDFSFTKVWPKKK